MQSYRTKWEIIVHSLFGYARKIPTIQQSDFSEKNTVDERHRWQLFDTKYYFEFVTFFACKNWHLHHLRVPAQLIVRKRPAAVKSLKAVNRRSSNSRLVVRSALRKDKKIHWLESEERETEWTDKSIEERNI